MSCTCLRDTPTGYGAITRLLHWSMALLFAWQFTSAILRVLADGTALKAFFWSTHATVGVTLWLLVLLRGTWGLINFSRRPKVEGPKLLVAVASAVHLILYVLMLVVPTLAIMRAVGNGRGFSVYGLQLVAPGGVPNAALVDPARAFHGVLGWTLLVLILGHIGAALYHRFILKDATLSRMTTGSSE
jgi:cytochrome b561